jgi:Mg2+ and Co2+ transporter CorA
VTSAAERTPAAEPVSLADAIAALDPSGRRALEQILRDPQTASEMLRRLARLDPDLIRTLRALDGETRALLLALTSDEERR